MINNQLIINHQDKLYFKLPFNGWERFNKSNLNNKKELFWDIFYVIYNSSAKDEEIYSASNDLTDIFYKYFFNSQRVEIAFESEAINIINDYDLFKL